MIAGIADGADLVEVVWSSFAAGIGVTVAYGIAILGGSRAVDFSRTGRMVGAAAYGLLGFVAAGVVLAAIVFGIVAMSDK